MPSFPLYTLSFAGLGPITARELQNHFGAAIGPLHTWRVRDSDLVCFSFGGSLDELFGLGTAEDLFYQLDRIPLSGARLDLELIGCRFQAASLDPGLALHRQRPGRRQRPTFRVVVQARDAPWRHYRRRDMQTALAQAIGRRFPRWRCVEDDAALEFWLQQADRAALLGLRLSDRSMRHRAYKQAHLPGSLRPTIAHALAYLSGPQPADVFLDPLCGTGTVLIERARAGRHGLLLGGDLRPEAVACARENLGPRHRPRGLLRWDATRLPLPDACADKAATNLPWGRQLGSPRANPALYAGVLAEVGRVLRRGGRAVFLTSEFELFKQTAKEFPELKITEQFRGIAVLGREADIFVVEKEG